MIRKFKSDDIDRVMEIWLNSNINAHKFIEKEYWENNYNEVKKVLPSADVFVFEQNDEILGFIGLLNSYIAGIFVLDSARSGGIGHKLIGHAKKIRRTLTLGVYKDNLRAIKFYLREGFTVQSEQLDPDTGAAELTMRWQS